MSNAYHEIMLIIKNERLIQNKSQKQMAENLNISQTSYGKIEQGMTEVSFERILLMCDFLKLSIFDILRKVIPDAAYNLDRDRFMRLTRTLENNIDYFKNVENHVILLGKKKDDCQSALINAPESLPVKIEALATTYQELLNAIEIYKFVRAHGEMKNSD